MQINAAALLLQQCLIKFLLTFIGNAAGQQTPHLIIFKGARLPNDINSFLQQGFVADKSETGWMNCDVFYNYIANQFYPWLLNNGIELPVISFVDGHISHRSLKLCEFCATHKIILVSFIPNATQYVQPMDVAVFRSIKIKWSNVLQSFKASHPDGTRLSKPNFCEQLKKCFDECLSSQLLKKAFESTALYPFGAENVYFSKLPTNADNPIIDERDTHTINNDNIHYSDDFITQFKNSIEMNFPNMVNEFKSTTGNWEGDQKSADLYVLWKSCVQCSLNVNQNSLHPEENTEVEQFDR